jgi:hypothetical protein
MTPPRRVLLQRPPQVDERGKRDRWSGHGNFGAWEAARELQLRARIHPIVRLTDEGIDWGVQPQPGDEIGYGMHPYRTDDCLQAAIATATQVPIEQVPSLDLHERRERGEDPEEISRDCWERIDRWATKRSLALTFWDQVPPARDRWIGVVLAEAGDHAYAVEGGRLVLSDTSGAFNDHCLVMSWDRLVFDPSCSIKLPPGLDTEIYDTSQIGYGISFDGKEG